MQQNQKLDYKEKKKAKCYKRCFALVYKVTLYPRCIARPRVAVAYMTFVFPNA